MSRSRPRQPKGSTAARSGSGRKSPAARPGLPEFLSPASIRETVESVAVALILAFLVRAFDGEAFVIPTGSMASTLMGRHKDVTCLKCGYPYQVSASQELDESGEPTGLQVIAGTCPMCRFTMDVGPQNDQHQSYPSFSGDRILAGRFNDDPNSPQRWDVTVFHYPLKATTDYIKRVVGLPNETLRIQYGDVWIKPDGADHFTPARKPPWKVLATMQPVYDNDYLLGELLQKGWPARWAPLEPADAPGAWKASPDGRSFQTDGAANEERWLGYQHLVPGYEVWAFLMGLSPQRPGPPRAQLIRDFNAYDTEVLAPFGPPGNWRAQAPPAPLPGGLGQPPHPAKLGLNWVGDLIVQFDLRIDGSSGEILVELVKGGRQFRCRLDLAKGTAELGIVGVQGFQASSPAGIRTPGRHQVRLANVDQQLLLWIDGRLVDFDAPTAYDLAQVDTVVPNKEDLTPVRVGSHGAAAEVKHLKIYRDIYYIAQQAHGDNVAPPVSADFDPDRPDYPYVEPSPERVAEFFSDPGQWAVFRHRRVIEFALGKDQYFMLGDNSAASKDSRLWDGAQFYVDRDLLVGKALVVYWPHSWDRIPGTPIPLPMFPNFARMRLVR